MTEKTNLEIFNETDEALQRDATPSRYLTRALAMGHFNREPFTMLKALQETAQQPDHHPEGNAWNHTIMVTDEAAKIKTRSINPRAFMWAALLHDLGKPGATKIRRGRVTSYDHDKLGAKLASEFLSHFTADTKFIRQVSALVRWHMQILFVNKELPFADVRAMKKDVDVREVALLGFCDRMGRLGANRTETEKGVRLFLKKCGVDKFD